MTNTALITRRGFIVGSDQVTLSATPSKDMNYHWINNEDAVEFFEDFRRQGTSVITPEMFVTLTLRLTHAIQDPERWALYNAKFNPNKAIENVKFIVDTIRYVLTGHRDIDIMTWGEMLPKGYFDECGARRDNTGLFNQVWFPPMDDFMSKWASQRHGIHDMFHTYRLLLTDH